MVGLAVVVVDEVSVWEREMGVGLGRREREKGKEREKGRERERIK